MGDGKSLAFSLMTARVVSAILSITGVQSSLPVEETRLSMAPLMMSIPGDKTQESLNKESEWRNSLQRKKRKVCFYRWAETRTSYQDTAHETSAPTRSLAWGTLSTESTDNKHWNTPAGGFITRQHLTKFQLTHDNWLKLEKINQHLWIF